MRSLSSNSSIAPHVQAGAAPSESYNLCLEDKSMSSSSRHQVNDMYLWPYLAFPSIFLGSFGRKWAVLPAPHSDGSGRQG